MFEGGGELFVAWGGAVPLVVAFHKVNAFAHDGVHHDGNGEAMAGH